jgi:hypothetical protein
MRNLLLALLFLFSANLYSQQYKEPLSFRSDIWLIMTAEEAVRPPGDTINMTWVKRTVRKRSMAVYIDISKDSTVIYLKYPRKMLLKSYGLPNNGFIGEKQYKANYMSIQSYALDEKGNKWLVTVGKDGYSFEPDVEGRIYISVVDTRNLQSSWYFTLNKFGEQK